MPVYKKINNASGFTLIEVIVAISIFAVLGVGCYRVMSGISSSRDVIKKHSESQRKISKAVRILDTDFRQIISRNVLDENGDQQSAVRSGDAAYGGDGVLVEFSRQGMRNPLSLKRAEVARIGYGFEETISEKEAEKWGISKTNNNDKNGYLFRYQWPVLDRGNGVEPERQLLLANITKVELEFLDKENKWREEWPPVDGVKFTFELGQQQAASSEIPYAIKLKISSAEYGLIERFYALHQIPKSLLKGE